MIVAGMSRELMPLRYVLDRTEERAVRREAELTERKPLSAALTRARRAVLVTPHGEVNPWLARAGGAADRKD